MAEDRVLATPEGGSDKLPESFVEEVAQISVLDPAEYKVIFESANDVEVNKKSELTITLKSESTGNDDIKLPCTPECLLKTVASGSTIKCEVVAVKGIEYRVEYTPTVRGQHELIVTLKGQAVGSPLSVFVSIHPTQLGKTVKTITGLESPMGVAVNSAGEIIVADSDYIILLNKNGDILKKISRTKYEFYNDFRRVCVDLTTDCIYVVGSKLVKLSPDFELQKEVYSYSSDGFRGLGIVGDKVMACHDDKQIIVFNKDLQKVDRIHNRVFSTTLGDIVSDGSGKFFVSDFGNRCVHMMSDAGKLLYSMRRMDSYYVMLERPFGMCIVGQYLYIVDHQKNCIVVFTTKGKYVTNFSKSGSGEDSLFCPRGACADRDGFVYVCDPRNYRIQVF